MYIAALRGTISHINEMDFPEGTQVVIEKNEHVTVITKEIFDNLYYKLDDFTAALKMDCIEYVVYKYHKTMEEYPDWYVDAVYDNIIFNIGGTDFFYTCDGEIAMSPKAIILRNRFGELRYMETKLFDELYVV